MVVNVVGLEYLVEAFVKIGPKVLKGTEIPDTLADM